MTNPNFLTRPIFSDTTVDAVFSEDNFIRYMLRFEGALAETQGALGLIPAAAAEEIVAVVNGIEIDAGELAQGVASAGVPVPALLSQVRSELTEGAADWVHFGATSQDVVDTAFILCLRDVVEIVTLKLSNLLGALESKSVAFADLPMMARTRTQLATPTSLGLKIAQWAQPLIAHEAEVDHVSGQALRVQVGGASGNRSALGKDGAAVAAGLSERLQLSISPPWHTDRSGLLRLANWLIGIVIAVSKLAGDVLIYQRNEVGELRAGAGGGSSAMPHKSNPVKTEALQSISVAAAAMTSGLVASSAHQEERDGSNWPVEWLLMPQLASLTGAALDHAVELISTLDADADRMQSRIEAVPQVFTEAIVLALLPKVGRKEAIELAKAATSEGTSPLEFLAGLGHDDIEWSDVFSPDSAIAPSKEIAKAIFAVRGR